MSEVRKLTYSQVTSYRKQLLKTQGGLCALCGLPIAAGQDVLDHCHKNGHLRGTLHRGCNSFLGKLENNYKRYGVPDLGLFLGGVFAYLTRTARIPHDQRIIHPTFKTDEEKKAERNRKARERRAAAKAAGNRP